MDRREVVRRRGPHRDGFDSFDPVRMALSVTLDSEDEDAPTGQYEYPARYKVCDLCEGQGKHVNPNIDANGIVCDEFYDDPDFAEAYFNGAYDVPCYECAGHRVVPVVDEEQIALDYLDTYRVVRAWVDERDSARDRDMAEEAAERRYIYGY